MSLHLRQWPRPTPEVVDAASRLVLLHGFTQNSNCWGLFGDALAERLNVAAVDAPGHGLSDPAHDSADLWGTADLLKAELQQERLRKGPQQQERPAPILVGYSMGGRMALHFALAHPQALAGVVLIGATAGIADDQERAQRRLADQELAGRIRRSPLDEFLDRWLANPLFEKLSPEAAAMSARLQNRPEGLASSLEHCGTGSQTPLWGRLADVAVPTLLITGSDDRKFTDLANRMEAALINSTVVVETIPGTHAVHLERPLETAAVIDRWVRSVGHC